ncbi:MAG: tetratricopeptide repeat protein [Limisphaera sp.]
MKKSKPQFPQWWSWLQGPRAVGGSRADRRGTLRVMALLLAGMVGMISPVGAAEAAPRTREDSSPAKKARVEPQTSTAGPVSPGWIPLPEDHPLAAFWNDPEFLRRVVGSYGFLGRLEPPLTAEEQEQWRQTVVPALREDPHKAIEVLKPLVGPTASALFDFTLGTAFLQAGDPTNAQVHLEAAVAKHPEFLRAWKNLGFVRARLGDAAGAARALGRALELGGADASTLGILGAMYLQSGRPVAAAAATQQALLFKPDDFTLQLQLLQAWFASAQYEPALRLVDELLSTRPDRVALWQWKAQLHLQRNERKEALVAYETLRRLGGARAEDLFALADLYVMSDAPEEAAAVYREALATGSAAAPERALRAAEVLLAQGQTAVVGALLDAIHRVEGALPPAVQNQRLRLHARWLWAEGKAEAALERLEECLRRFPADGQALLLAGDWYAHAGDREKAEFRYQAAAQIEAVAPDALVKHAQLLVRHQEYRRAAELLQRAQRLRPREPVQRYLDEVVKLATSRPASS